MIGLVPPRSMSLVSSDCQLVGAQKSMVPPLKTGPGWRRIMASLPPQGVVPLGALPVAT